MLHRGPIGLVAWRFPVLLLCFFALSVRCDLPLLNRTSASRFFAQVPNITAQVHVGLNTVNQVFYFNCSMCKTFLHSTYMIVYLAGSTKSNTPAVAFGVHPCVAGTSSSGGTIYKPCSMMRYGFPTAQAILTAMDTALASFPLPLFGNFSNSYNAANGTASLPKSRRVEAEPDSSPDDDL